MGANRGEALLEINNEQFGFQTNIYGVGWFAATSNALLGQFAHIVGVYRRGAKLQLWVNGELKSETPIPMGTLNHGRSTHASAVGAYAPEWLEWGRNNQIFSWLGTVDQVRIYSRALNGNEINSLYTSGQ
jgi:hypothetical protein